MDNDRYWLATIISRHKAAGYEESTDDIYKYYISNPRLASMAVFLLCDSIKKDLEWIYLKRKYGLILGSIYQLHIRGVVYKFSASEAIKIPDRF